MPPPTPIKVTRVDISALSAGTKGRTRDVTVEVTDVDGTGDKTSVSRGRTPSREEYHSAHYEPRNREAIKGVCSPFSKRNHDRVDGEYLGNPYAGVVEWNPVESTSQAQVPSLNVSYRSRSVTPPMRHRPRSLTPSSGDGRYLEDDKPSSRLSRVKVRDAAPESKPSRSRSRSKGKSGFKNNLLKFWVFFTKPIILYTRDYQKQSARKRGQGSELAIKPHARFDGRGPDSPFERQTLSARPLGGRKHSFGLSELVIRHPSK